MANKVYITNRQKDVKIPSGTRMLIRRCCNAALEIEKFKGGAEVSVSFVNNEEIKELNGSYRNKPVETDVLSFPYYEEENGFPLNEDTGLYAIGDIVISVQKAMEQAAMYGHTLQREMAYLTVHSMLHLLGYDHENGGLEQVRMREREEYILAKLGLPRGSSYVILDKKGKRGRNV